MIVRDLQSGDENGIQRAAAIALDGFSHITFCDTIEEASEEVNEALQPGKICLAAYDDAGEMVGWIGGYYNYARVWELHPLVVHPGHRRRGAGRALIQALEKRIVTAGGLTIFLGTDDEAGGTNLFGQELYPDVLGQALQLEATGDHPFAFYQKLGYVVTGLVPDANGIGKPDILMCKRVGKA